MQGVQSAPPSSLAPPAEPGLFTSLKARLSSAAWSATQQWKKLVDIMQGSALTTKCCAWVMGVQYGSTTAEADPLSEQDRLSLMADLQSRIWCTYRRDFVPLGAQGLTSDVGWGCTIRSGQMMLAEALSRHMLGRSWRQAHIHSSSTSHEGLMQVLSALLDHPLASLSIHRICSAGQPHGIVAGKWLGPWVLCKALAGLVNSTPQLGLKLHVVCDPGGGAPSVNLHQLLSLMDPEPASTQQPGEPPPHAAQTQLQEEAAPLDTAVSGSVSKAAEGTDNSSAPPLQAHPTTGAQQHGTKLQGDQQQLPGQSTSPLCTGEEPASCLQASTVGLESQLAAQPAAAAPCDACKEGQPYANGTCAHLQASSVPLQQAGLRLESSNGPTMQCHHQQQEQELSGAAPAKELIVDTLEPTAGSGVLVEITKLPSEKLLLAPAGSIPCTVGEMVQPEQSWDCIPEGAQAAVLNGVPPCVQYHSAATDMPRPLTPPLEEKTFPQPASPGNAPLGLVLLLPLTLGVGKVNPVYYPQLLKVLAFPQSIGIVGGRPSASLFFVGFQEQSLLYLDPHVPQQAGMQPQTYFSDTVRTLPITSIDPSLAIGFYCETKDELIHLVEQLQALGLEHSKAPIVTITSHDTLHSVASEGSQTPPMHSADAYSDWEVL